MDTSSAESSNVTTSSQNGSSDPMSHTSTVFVYSTWQVILISNICAVIIIGTLVGNILVCTAVGITRKLRAPPSNLLIVSLAVSDLLVAALDMPFATVYEVMGRWTLGPTMCDVWTSLDVFLCTASILNLCVISVDRYLVITRPFQYALKRTPWRMLAMIAAVWVLSAIISIPPLFWSKATDHYNTVEYIQSDVDLTRHYALSDKDNDSLKDDISFSAQQCQLSQSIGYQFYATIGAFYIPLIIMVVIYTRIYHVSSRIARSEVKSKVYLVHSGTSSCSPHDLQALMNGRQMSLTPTLGSTATLQRVGINLNHSDDGRLARDSTTGFVQVRRSRAHSLGDLLPHRIRASCSAAGASKASSAGASERKATKTLGVIMGAFVICWLPFFILALIKPFCHDSSTCIPAWLSSLFLWLGFANSFLNPIIYARFNRDFRTPFKYILQCRCRNINARLRNEEYAVQFGPIIDRRESTLTNGAADPNFIHRF